MQLVININEHLYKTIKTLGLVVEDGDAVVVSEAIMHGIPLPKGHGDLIDKNEIIKRYERDCGKRIYVDNFIHDIELNTPTIIEADNEDKEV